MVRIDQKLEFLLRLDGSAFRLAAGYTVKVEARVVEATRHRPYGVKYNLTQHMAGMNLSPLAGRADRWIDEGDPCRRPKRVVLDMDASVRPTPGEQEMSLWNGHYECACYERAQSRADRGPPPGKSWLNSVDALNRIHLGQR